ncbi:MULTISPECIES: DUF3658 domain-containing protein [Burkholderia]|uniref:DUF3658 domain-containing protein n=1 Tax=Burkholderia TaxID=32008 RepID=UPI0009B89686|nr:MULTISPECIES: DUF3658 domain-containing protein [Burkholderia]
MIKGHKNLVHASFSDITFNVIESAIANGNLTGPHVLIDGNWHLGPLKKRNISTLSTWFSDHFGYIPDDLTIQEPIAATDKTKKICAWVDPLSSVEYANFLHWISHQTTDDFFVVPVPKGVAYPAQANFLELTERFNNAIEKKSNDIKTYTHEWGALIEENGDFRLIDETGTIRSLQSSDFDEYILSSTAEKWEPSPIVVLRIMEKIHFEKRDFPGDIFLYHRLKKLSDTGVIEKKSETSITQTQIRIVNS